MLLEIPKNFCTQKEIHIRALEKEKMLNAKKATLIDLIKPLLIKSGLEKNHNFFLNRIF